MPRPRRKPGNQTQLNIAIDAELHHRLRLEAVMRRTSLRELSETLLREGLSGGGGRQRRRVAGKKT